MDPRLQADLEQRSLARQLEREAAAARVARGEKPWEGAEGPASAVEAVRDLRFPRDAADLAAEAGDRAVRIGGGRELPLRDVLDALGEGFYASLHDLEATLAARWDAVRARAGTTAMPPA